ncbi:hypothetical protein ABZP36_010637 [Zizania latifolia]
MIDQSRSSPPPQSPRAAVRPLALPVAPPPPAPAWRSYVALRFRHSPQRKAGAWDSGEERKAGVGDGGGGGEERKAGAGDGGGGEERKAGTEGGGGGEERKAGVGDGGGGEERKASEGNGGGSEERGDGGNGAAVEQGGAVGDQAR